MTAAKKKGGLGGRRFPPKDGLIGRTEAARLLQCDRQTVRRLEKKGFLKPAVTEPDGVTWFDLVTVQALAAQMKTWRASAKIRRQQRRAAARTTTPSSADDYYPELRSRRTPLAGTPRPPAKTAPVAQERPRPIRNAGTAPRGIGPRTPSRDEWWDGDLAPDDVPRAVSNGTEVDPAWFDDDFKPQE